MMKLYLTMFGGGGSESGLGADKNSGKGKKLTGVSDPISRIDDSSAIYVLYNKRGKELRDVKGTSLQKLVSSGELIYDARLEKWKRKDGGRIIIRKRK